MSVNRLNPTSYILLSVKGHCVCVCALNKFSILFVLGPGPSITDWPIFTRTESVCVYVISSCQHHSVKRSDVTR